LKGDLGASQYRTSKERKEERPKRLEVMDRKAECKVVSYTAICLRNLFAEFTMLFGGKGALMVLS
jgi:hypothetical protein